MSHTEIKHYRFSCDAAGCHITSPVISGTSISDAGRACERHYGWHIVGNFEREIFEYCPEHYGLGEE